MQNSSIHIVYIRTNYNNDQVIINVLVVIGDSRVTGLFSTCLIDKMKP